MILACDSGGSKTLLHIYSKDELIEEHRLPGVAAALDSEADLPELRHQLITIKEKYPIKAVAFNLGGRNKTQIERILQNIFPHIPSRVFRESEGVAGLALASRCPAECVLLTGTGTISIARHPTTKEIAVNGGWGPLMGDEGSGYHIGLKALRHCIEQVDGAERTDLLSSIILNRECGIPIDRDASVVCKTRDEVFRVVSPLDRKHIASYTRTVTACCDRQDPFCLTLMQEAGADMAALVARSLDKLGLEQVKGILITGGLLHARKFWQQAFEQELARYRIKRFHYIPNAIMLGTKIIAEESIKKC